MSTPLRTHQPKPRPLAHPKLNSTRQVRRLFPHHFGLRKKPEAAWLGVDPRSLILLTSVAVTLALFVALELLPLMQVEGLGVRGCPPVFNKKSERGEG